MNKINLDKSAAHIAPTRQEPRTTVAIDTRTDPAEVSRRQVAYLSRLGLRADRARLVAHLAFGGGAR